MPSPPPFSEDDLRAAIARADCWAAALRLLGYRTASANYRTVRRWAQRWDIPTDHFDAGAARARATRGRARPLSEVMVAGSAYPRGTLKRRLFAAGMKQPVCEMCGQDENWRGGRMSLVLDHINGVSDDHRLENLRIVCPNCAATLATHCGRNLPQQRACVACGASFAPRSIHHRYCSQRCWGTIAGGMRRGVPHPERRKVERPTYEVLVAELTTRSYLAVGRRYGVSDNAVRKWLRTYERERHAGEGGGRG